MSNLRASTIVKTISDLSTPFHLAAQNGHTEVAKVFLENGAVIDNLDVMKWTPLHWAAKGGHLETAKLLLEYNALCMVKEIPKHYIHNCTCSPIYKLYTGCSAWWRVHTISYNSGLKSFKMVQLTRFDAPNQKRKK